MEEEVKKLREALNELVKCLIYDTSFIKIINKLGLQVKEQYRRD